MINTVVFDFNGVLVNDLRIHEEAYWRAAKDLGFDTPRETIERFISYPPKKKRTFYFGEISDETWRRLFELKEKYYYDLAASTDIVFSDVEAVLNCLSQRYVLAILSNTHRGTFQRVFPQRLARLFKESMFADEVEKPKPAPDPLLKMMQRLSVVADECCYVGDSVLDVRMAKTVGVKMFAVATGDNSEEDLLEAGADCVLSSLRELTPLLET